MLANFLPIEQLDSYVAGLILLATAPCTAMAFVWSNLCNGDAKFTLSHIINSSFANAVTLVLLFGFQGQQILIQQMIIGLLVVPIVIQAYFNSMLVCWLSKKLKVTHCVAGPSALIGASYFFELAVATALPCLVLILLQRSPQWLGC